MGENAFSWFFSRLFSVPFAVNSWFIYLQSGRGTGAERSRACETLAKLTGGLTINVYQAKINALNLEKEHALPLCSPLLPATYP